MKRHIDKYRGDLSDLHGMAAKTEAAERNILAAAEKRHAAVVAEIDHLQPGVEGGSPEVHDKYLELVSERGQLEIVLSKARAILAG